jgi:hypothetical protein
LENNRNGELINQAIQAAASLGEQKPGYIGDGTLITTIYDDPGFVDYVKLSFRLFGLRIEALYYTFFVLLGISALAFLWTFRGEIAAQITLLATLFAFYVEAHTTIFSLNMPTFVGMRHGSTVALVPTLHFAFLLLYGNKLPAIPWRNWRAAPLLVGRQGPRIATLALAVVQLAILILAIRIRGSAVWAAVFLFCLAAVLAGMPRWRDLRSLNAWRPMLADTFRWPVLVVLLGMIAHGQYMKAVLHPVYFTDDVLPYHGLWHSAYLGIVLHSPESLPPVDRERLKAGMGLDQIGYRAAVGYLEQIHFARWTSVESFPPAYISPLTHTIKFRFHDDIMRRLVLRTIGQHPIAMAQMYALKKPWAILGTIVEILRSTGISIWGPLVALGGLIGFGAAISTGALALDRFKTAAALVAGSLPFAMLPNLWAYPMAHTIADAFLITLVLLQLAVSLLLFRGLELWRRTASGRSAQLTNRPLHPN